MISLRDIEKNSNGKRMARLLNKGYAIYKTYDIILERRKDYGN